MLSATVARAIAENPYTYVYDRIEEAAHNHQFQCIFDHYLDSEIVDYLMCLGYKVEFKQEDIFGETPYGYTNEIISSKFKTIVSW